jgi:CheY-like chemotaxis protein
MSIPYLQVKHVLGQMKDKHLGNNISLFHDVQKQEQLKKEKLSPNVKRILLVDDDPDITLTFKKGLEEENETSGNKVVLQVFSYNNPLLALAEFKTNFYDLLLIDINMPKMNGFEFSEKVLELDLNVRICFTSAAELNIRALREQYKSLSLGCFITKPVTIENLIRIRKTEIKVSYVLKSDNITKPQFYYLFFRNSSITNSISSFRLISFNSEEIPASSSSIC